MNKLVYILFATNILFFKNRATALFPLWDPPTISDGTGFTPTLVPTWERGRREIDSPSLSRFSLNRRTACLKREWRLGRLNTPPFEGELSAVRRLHLLLLQVEHTRQRRRFPSIRRRSHRLQIFIGWQTLCMFNSLSSPRFRPVGSATGVDELD